MDFYEYDALVLRTVCSGNENNPIGIEEIITMADCIYRLILSHWEVDTGLDRLIQAGYVIRQNDKFFVSHEVREFVNTKLNRLGTLKQVETLGKFLKIDYSRHKSLEQFGLEKIISIRQYNEAVDNYKNRFKAHTKTKRNTNNS